MKSISLFPAWFVLLTAGTLGASAQLTVMPETAPQRVVGGNAHRITVVLRNADENPFKADIKIRLSEASSAISARISDEPWKTLHMLPGQTIIESAEIAFPNVRAETRFLIQWIEGTNHVLGTTDVLVYPTNLLAQFKTLAGEEPLGLFDPANQIKPLLRALAVEFQDLVEDGTDKFHGKLAIFGPFESRKQMRASLTEDIRALAKRGVAVVWLRPPPEPHARLMPSFYTVRFGNGAVVVAEHTMVLRLADSPEAQLNLIRLAEVALRGEPMALPDIRNSN